MRCSLPHLLPLLAALMLLGSGCKNEAPSPWKEMYFPLKNSTILPGANAERIKVKYKNTRKYKEYFREYKSALQNAGYMYTMDAPNHDPGSSTFAAFFEKEGKRIRLTIYSDAHTHADVHFDAADK